MGDFNLAPDHASWSAMHDLGATPAITQGATTLGTTNDVWSNLYDNIWHDDRAPITASGIIQFPDLLPGDHITVRSSVSDHAPVWIALGGAKLELTTFEGGAYDAANDAVGCIGLNDATVEQLGELPNVGPARAAQIIDMRPWGKVEALTRVSGLGAASVQAIKESELVCN